jgi:hypothetical protein
LIGLIDLSREPKTVYVQSPICNAYALSDMRRITLVLMYILIQSPSSYKSSFSYKRSNGAETHDASTHATINIDRHPLGVLLHDQDPANMISHCPPIGFYPVPLPPQTCGRCISDPVRPVRQVWTRRKALLRPTFACHDQLARKRQTITSSTATRV